MSAPSFIWMGTKFSMLNFVVRGYVFVMVKGWLQKREASDGGGGGVMVFKGAPTMTLHQGPCHAKDGPGNKRPSIAQEGPQ